MKSRDNNETCNRDISDGLGLQMTLLSITAKPCRVRASTIAAIAHFQDRIHGGFHSRPLRETVEVVGGPKPWLVKVVSTLFVCCSHFPDSAVKYLSENLNSSLAFEVIKRFSNPGIGLKFLEFSRNRLSIEHSFWTYNLLMRSLCKVGLHGSVKVAFDRMRSDGRLPDSSLLGFLVNSFVQAREFDLAVNVVTGLNGEVVGINLLVCNNLLNALIKQNKVFDAVRLFEDHLVVQFSPNTWTFNVLIGGLCRIGEIAGALQFFDEMSRYQCSPDVVTYNTLINGLCRANEVDKARKLLKEVRSRDDCSPNVVTYTSIISGFCKMGKMDEASHLFEEMIRSGVEPNSFTFNALIDGYGKAGNMVSAQSLCENMASFGCLPDVVTFSSLIDGYCRTGQLNLGLRLLDVMRIRNISPNVYTFAILINTLCKENRLCEARELLKQLNSSSNIVPRAFIYNPVIDILCKAGNVDEANSIVEEMEKKRCNPDKVTFTILIIGHCMKGRMVEAIALFNKMLAIGCAPDKITVSALVSCLLKAGMPNEAFHIARMESEDINLGLSSYEKGSPLRLNRGIPVAA